MRTNRIATLGPDLEKLLRFVTRAHPSTMAGWRVWVTFNGVDYGQTYFGDLKYGGQDEALLAALAYRDKVIKKHHIPLRSYAGNGYCVQSSRSKTGVPGVTLSYCRRGESVTVRWHVRYQDEGAQQHKSWSVRKYGYVGAWRLATQVRARVTGTQPPALPPPPPPWLLEWAKDIELSIPEEVLTQVGRPSLGA